MQCNIKLKYLLYILILLQILDGILTYYGLQFFNFNLKYEGNPLLRNMMKSYGVLNSLIIVKTIGILFCSYFLIFKKQLVNLTNKYFINSLCVITILIYFIFSILAWSFTLLFN